LPAVEARGRNVDEEEEGTIVRPCPVHLPLMIDFGGGRLYGSKPHLLIAKNFGGERLHGDDGLCLERPQGGLHVVGGCVICRGVSVLTSILHKERARTELRGGKLRPWPPYAELFL
jgi:hypothetical protein